MACVIAASKSVPAKLKVLTSHIDSVGGYVVVCYRCIVLSLHTQAQ